MSDYVAPMTDMQFVLRELARLDIIGQLPGYEEATQDTVDAILLEASKFAGGVLSPLNQRGDREGVTLRDHAVSTSIGWREAYDQFVSGGWNSLSCHPRFGGHGLPRLVSTLVEEMWNSANVSFALCPMLTRGAIEAIEQRGSDQLKRAYLPKLVTGEWTGTMNLTEPQAGSDLSAIRTRAMPENDGTYRLIGQKIFITYGEHDLAPNIIHLVLARTPNAPEGIKGISLFVVPKFLLDTDGQPSERNDVRCVSVEHKLGIHGSPTCVMAFGDQGGAIGYMVGEENRGVEYMFTMMNATRFAVGLEGIGIAERAYQRARDFARSRVQGVEAGVRDGGKVAIIRHPDIRRMLMLMRSQTEAMRALACVVAAATDTATLHPETDVRTQHQAFVDLMIPIVKGWSTENAVDIASLGIQIHGGMGYVEETGAAQYLRDARIGTIYEGTTGIQAIDLVGRKIARDQGRAMVGVIAQMREVAAALARAEDAALQPIGPSLEAGVVALEQAVGFVLSHFAKSPQNVLAGAVPLLKLFGSVAGGWQMGRAALVASRRLRQKDGDAAFLRTKISTARFYADHILSQAPTFSRIVCESALPGSGMTDDDF